MKKKVILMSSLMLFIFSLSSCNKSINSEKEVSCEDIMTIYIEAGYEIFHKETIDQDYIWNCSLKCSDPDSEDYIYFYFFENIEDAESYAKEREWNLLLYVFSVIFDNPSWLKIKTYNNIVIEYDNNELYKPFKSLI